jgi:DnaK suppressor protein
VPDATDASTANFQQAIDMTLLQIKATTLAHIDEALGRIDAGQYGSCVECKGPISGERLRALPFAARCLECEVKREREQGDSRAIAQRDASPFSHVTG